MAKDSRSTGVGIAMSADMVVAVEARIRGGLIEVSSWGALTAPPESMAGTVVSDPSRIGGTLRALKRDANLKSKAATASLFAPGYGMRSIRLPEVPENERRTLVRGELEDAASLPVGGGAFDFIWIPVATEDGKRQADVSAYYVNDQTVEITIDALRQGGFDLDGMEPASIAMARAYAAINPTRRPVAILCPSEKHCDLVMHDGTQIRLVRRIPAGWSDVAESSAELEANERMLGGAGGGGRPAPEPGVPTATGIWSGDEDYPDVFTEGATKSAAPPASPFVYNAPVPEAAPALERTSSSAFLASEVTRTLAFYLRENPEAPRPEALAILAPGPIVRELRRVLINSLPIPVSTSDPFAGLQLPAPSTPGTLRPAAEMQDLILAAIGCALSASDADVGVPLIDISQQEADARSRKRAPVLLLAGMAGSTLWMIGAAVAAIALSFLETSAQNDNGRLTAEITKIKEERAALLKASELGNAALEAYNKTSVPAAAVLGRVAASTTPGVSLTGVRVTNTGTIEIDGKATSEAAMQQFMIMLARGQVIKTPYFQMIRQDPSGNTFKIVGVFKEKV